MSFGKGAAEIRHIRETIAAKGVESGFGVIAAAGITPDNVVKVAEETGAREIHLSARERVVSDAFVGSELFDRDYFESESEKVWQVVKALNP